ncbi:MAG TPA: elongation factor Ts [Firmicutes bacterium]|nr:elongation factor Ts [Bacillota bacterium]
MITAEMVKELRTVTGAGMMDCKNALVETAGDREKAIALLREKGLARAAKKASRVAAQGIVDAYIHLGGKVGVLLELDCETDFVAKTAEFKELARDICLQVAATNPSYLVKDDVPADILDKEKEILRAQALREGKPEKIVDKIVSGRIEKYYQENCLMEQSFIKDQDITIRKLVAEKIAKLGENMVVRRFVRFEVGEGQVDEANC